MKHTVLKIVKINLFLVSSGLIAGILNTPIAVPDKNSLKRPDYLWNTSSYVGYAWSQNAHIRMQNPTKFNQPVIGDTNDNNLNNVPYAGFSISRRFHKFLKIGFSYDVYGNFLYRKYHYRGITPVPMAGVEILGMPYSRSFALDHQGALFNLGIKLPKKCEVVVINMHIVPEFSGGVGVGISKVKSFQSLGYISDAPYSQLTTVGGTNATKKLAWQFTIGLALLPKNSAVSFGIAYRYYNGGTFASSNVFMLNDSYNQGAPVALGAWSGTLRTQQLKMYINAEF